MHKKHKRGVHTRSGLFCYPRYTESRSHSGYEYQAEGSRRFLRTTVSEAEAVDQVSRAAAGEKRVECVCGSDSGFRGVASCMSMGNKRETLCFILQVVFFPHQFHLII